MIKTMKTVIRVHRSGMVYIVVSVVMGVLSVNSGNNFHYLATAAMLGFMLASGIAGRANIRGAEVTFDFPDEIYAATPFLLTVEVRNRKRRSSIYLIELNVDGEPLLFPVIGPGETSRLSLVFSFPKRGTESIKEVRLFSVYPFNLFTRYWDIEGDLSSIVFPTPLRPASEQVYTPPDDERPGNKAPRLLAEEDTVGVRPYTEGDSMRQIHWKSSARTGKLSTRIYDESAAGGGKIIDLEGLLAGGKENALSLAAYVIREAILSGEAVGMQDTNALFPVSAERRDKFAMLKRLALHE